MGDRTAYSARIASVAASTAIALACGTNYAYSAWGPEFAERMGFSATESNVIGVAGNLGMYAFGIPAGLLVDRKGPRWAVAIGAISLACGYFPIYKAYEGGSGSMSLAFISFCAFLTGAGSCTAFSAAVKTSTFNWPEHRGTASAFPLSGFGLSAFFFAVLGSVAFSGKTGSFLLILAIGTLCLNLVALPFMSLIRTSHDYAMLPGDDAQPTYDERAPSSREPLKVQETASAQRGKPLPSSGSSSSGHPTGDQDYGSVCCPTHGSAHQTSRAGEEGQMHDTYQNVQTEVTGLALLKHTEFYQLFAIMGLLAGVGLMTINNIGNDAKALWLRHDPTRSADFIQGREQMHVSILSVGSFCGRFLSGAGSDHIVKKLRASRFWCLVISAGVFSLAQVLALVVSDPNFLFLVSSLTGIGYGFLFGVFPALVADAFGTQGMSLNWGFFIAAPVLSGNIYNLSYGAIYDSHSEHGDGKKGECHAGLECYRSAYWLTLASSLAGMLMALWCIRHEKQQHAHARHHSRES